MTKELFPNTPLFWILVNEARTCAGFNVSQEDTRIWLGGFKWGWTDHCHQVEESGKYG